MTLYDGSKPAQSNRCQSNRWGLTLSQHEAAHEEDDEQEKGPARIRHHQVSGQAPDGSEHGDGHRVHQEQQEEIPEEPADIIPSMTPSDDSLGLGHGLMLCVLEYVTCKSPLFVTRLAREITLQKPEDQT